MSNASLLEQQTALIEYLLDPHQYAGTQNRGSPQKGLWGINPQRLRILGEISLNNRLKKVCAILPKTIQFLDDGLKNVFSEFSHTHPQSSLKHYNNAVQFCEFLSDRKIDSTKMPAFLYDLSRFELVIWRIELGPKYLEDDSPFARVRLGWGGQEYYFINKFESLHLNYQIRPFFEQPGKTNEPRKQSSIVLIHAGEHGKSAQVFEINVEQEKYLLGLNKSFENVPDNIPKEIHHEEAYALLKTLGLLILSL